MYLWVSVVFAMKQVTAEIETDSEVFLAGVDLCLQTLVVVHEKLYS